MVYLPIHLNIPINQDYFYNKTKNFLGVVHLQVFPNYSHKNIQNHETREELHPLHLQSGHELAPQLVDLGGDDHARVLQHRLHDRQHVQGVLTGRRFRCGMSGRLHAFAKSLFGLWLELGFGAVDQFGDDLQGEQRQGLMEGEAVLEVHAN